MAMKAIQSSEGSVTVISLEGTLDYENQVPLCASIEQLLRNGKHVVLDMEHLRFVGSSGITHFIQSIRDFYSMSDTVLKLCNVKSEFRKLMSAFDTNNSFIIHPTRSDAVGDFFGNRPGERN